MLSFINYIFHVCYHSYREVIQTAWENRLTTQGVSRTGVCVVSSRQYWASTAHRLTIRTVPGAVSSNELSENHGIRE